MHLIENLVNIIKLIKCYLKHKITLRGKDGQLFQLEARLRLRHEFGREYTEMPFLVSVKGHIPIRDPGRCEQDGVILNVEDFVGILNPVSPLDKAYLIVQSSVVGHRYFLVPIPVYSRSVKHVEMPDIASTLVFKKMVDFRAKRAANLSVEIFYRCRCHGIAKFKVK